MNTDGLTKSYVFLHVYTESIYFYGKAGDSYL